MNSAAGFTLKARPSYKWGGVCCTVCFSTMGVASVLVAATNADGSFKNPALAALAFGIFWGMFILLGVYLWLLSQKYRLEISDDVMKQTGVFTQKRIALLSITDASWRNRPQGGSIKLCCSESHLVIEFGLLTTEDRDSLIDFFRSIIPSQNQKDWDEFILNPERASARRCLSPLGRAILFYFFSITFIACWWWGLGLPNLIGAVINSVFATYLLTRRLRTEAGTPSEV